MATAMLIGNPLACLRIKAYMSREAARPIVNAERC